MVQVEIDQVVAQQETCAISQLVQTGQGVGQISAGNTQSQTLAGIGAHAGRRVDAAILDANPQVQGQAMGY